MRLGYTQRVMKTKVASPFSSSWIVCETKGRGRLMSMVFTVDGESKPLGKAVIRDRRYVTEDGVVHYGMTQTANHLLKVRNSK